MAQLKVGDRVKVAAKHQWAIRKESRRTLVGEVIEVVDKGERGLVAAGTSEWARIKFEGVSRSAIFPSTQIEVVS